ncbi:ribokinase [Novosphingobium aquimarinum]|uniref:ribokinase n=1 Tax=Novosphingobium aquimarinum TaxID=2682494 RepID=UPI0012EBAF41|nr:ribokinase [Novosphingobium aquimarinum]
MSVTVFGSLNLDVALRVPSRATWGQTVLVDDAAQAVGGKGLNQAVAAARFGSKTRMAGAIGEDEAGALLRSALEDEGVDTRGLATISGATSGRATILIEPGGDNFIAVETGANRLATSEMALAVWDPGTRVLLMQLETDIDAMAALLSHEASAPVRKIVNFAPALPEGRRLFDLTDMLIFNQSEFAEYLQLDREPEGLEDLLVARRILSRPKQAVVVTLGASGSAAVWADEAMVFPGFRIDDVVDTSGAGDCFCGVVASCVDQAIDPKSALRLANAAAALSVTGRGAAPSIPARPAVDAFLASITG